MLAALKTERWPRQLGVCALSVLCVWGLAGCYEHVVSAKGPGASAYDIQEPATDNTVIFSDLKGQPKRTLTKGGKPVDN